MSRSRTGGTRGLSLGTIHGAPVIVTAGWVLISLALVVFVGPQLQSLFNLGVVAYAAALVVPVLLFVSVLAHEVAHGFAARMRHVLVREYVITLWGGHTSFTGGMRGPADSAIIALAGPMANLALAGLGWFLGDGLGGYLGLGVAVFTMVNVIVGVFNLLPALPLDGGKLLEAAIWAIRSERTSGTIVAAHAGRVLAIGVVGGSLGWPLLHGERPSIYTVIWALVAAAVLWSGAQASLRQAKAQRRVSNVNLNELAIGAHILPGRAPVVEADRVLAATPSIGIVLVDDNGRPHALVDREAMGGVPAQDRTTVPLNAVARAVPPAALITLTHGAGAVAQVARAAEAGAVVVILVGPRGEGSTGHAQMLGLVPVATVVHLLNGQRA